MPNKPTPAEITGEVARILRLYRFTYTTEDDLQRGIAEALTEAEAPFTREFQMDSGRIDFMVHAACEVGIEVKVGGSPSAVGRQLMRYLKDDGLRGLVLVTSRRGHRKLLAPGKPFEVVWLGDVV
jgi:hypothetical protein